MEWFKKHVDTMIILGAFGSAIIWINGSLSDLRLELKTDLVRLDKEIASIDKEVSLIKTETAIIKTVLIMQNVMPKEMAAKE